MRLFLPAFESVCNLTSQVSFVDNTFSVVENSKSLFQGRHSRFSVYFFSSLAIWPNSGRLHRRLLSFETFKSSFSFKSLGHESSSLTKA